MSAVPAGVFRARTRRARCRPASFAPGRGERGADRRFLRPDAASAVPAGSFATRRGPPAGPASDQARHGPRLLDVLREQGLLAVVQDLEVPESATQFMLALMRLAGHVNANLIRRLSMPKNAKVVLVDPTDTPHLDEAVDFINRTTILSGLNLAREVGRYVLDHFFDGDYQSFSDPSRIKEQSFRALLAREDLLLGQTTLYNLVRVSNQLEILPPDVTDGLSFTHHRALLPLPDPKRKEELARRALKEGWTSNDLTAEVSKLLPKSHRGRKPSPAFVKTIGRIEKASSRVERIDAEEIRRLGPEKTEALAAQLEASLTRLEALKEALHATQTEVWPDS